MITPFYYAVADPRFIASHNAGPALPPPEILIETLFTGRPRSPTKRPINTEILQPGISFAISAGYNFKDRLPKYFSLPDNSSVPVQYLSCLAELRGPIPYAALHPVKSGAHRSEFQISNAGCATAMFGDRPTASPRHRPSICARIYAKCATNSSAAAGSLPINTDLASKRALCRESTFPWQCT